MVAVEDELHVRFRFTARAEIIRENISAVVIAQVTEISSHGCYLEFVQLEKGSRVLVKIFARGDFFEAGANVVYSQPNIGTALRTASMFTFQKASASLSATRSGT
jgi:hypothetical protein